jgi:PAS domain S-box-containing protein
MHDSELRAYLAAIVESSDDAIVSKDLNGRIQSFNGAAERMFGYTAAEIIGKSVLMLIPPERQAEEQDILSRLRRGERIDHYETVRIAKDGRRLDVSLTVSPVRDGSGRIVGASKIARDITEQKRAAHALAEQKEWFRVTLNSIGDGVIACDRDCCVTFINKQAERLTGWTSAEATGLPLTRVFDVLHDTTRRKVVNPAVEVLRVGEAVNLEDHTVLISRDGTEWPIADSASPIVDISGVTLGVVLVFREITELRRNETLARAAVAERERLLQDERTARSEAERANRVKDDFVAMISHELRTPLNAILGWTDLLRKHTDAATMEYGLEVIVRNTRLQAQLISDLLDVSRIVSGKLRLELEHVALGDVLQNSVDALQASAIDKGVDLAVDLGSGAAVIIGDPARLQQIVWNLLSNAIKFTPRGGRVTASLRRHDTHATMTVTDTGVGIRPDFLPHLFERFRQASSMTTRRYGGLGLGLSIAKHLTDLHGGTIRAWSAGEGQGATFTVELPLVPAGATDARPKVSKADVFALHTHSAALQNLKVLLVEDDADTRDLVSRLLESHQARVFVAANTVEALDLLIAMRPDILISDIGLPDVDGYELIRRVRQLADPIARIPAVALTAFARSEDRTRALGAGFNAHLAKPVEPAELVMTIGSFGNLVTAGRSPAS